MASAERLAKGWEARLPPVVDPWTHWQLEGDGFVLGVFPSHELGKLMVALKESHQRFSSIFANLAKIDAEGRVVLEIHRYEFTNRYNDTHSTL